MHCRLMEKILHCVQNDMDGQCNATPAQRPCLRRQINRAGVWLSPPSGMWGSGRRLSTEYTEDADRKAHNHAVAPPRKMWWWSAICDGAASQALTTTTKTRAEGPPTPCPESLLAGIAEQGRGWLSPPAGIEDRGAVQRHGNYDLKTMSPRQSTQGCGAAQHPGAIGRPTGQGCEGCTVSPQPGGMRRFGVQGCNATPALPGCPRTQGLFVGVSGAAARP
jgi:hypothetical protein